MVPGSGIGTSGIRCRVSLTPPPHFFAARALRVPAIAGDGERFSSAFTVRATVFAALRHQAFTPRMGALLGFLFGHDGHPLCYCFVAQQSDEYNPSELPRYQEVAASVVQGLLPKRIFLCVRHLT
jgi:hypothetical protein